MGKILFRNPLSLVSNEFIAYEQLSLMKEQLSPRSVVIATYALCGFANFGSIAIQVGGIGGLVPKRRSDFARYGVRAMIGGTLNPMAAYTTRKLKITGNLGKSQLITKLFKM